MEEMKMFHADVFTARQGVRAREEEEARFTSARCRGASFYRHGLPIYMSRVSHSRSVYAMGVPRESGCLLLHLA